jgi:hypothetical protein
MAYISMIKSLLFFLNYDVESFTHYVWARGGGINGVRHLAAQASNRLIRSRKAPTSALFHATLSLRFCSLEYIIDHDLLSLAEKRIAQFSLLKF